MYGFSPVVIGGPPFLTDDPNPVSYQHKNFYLFSILDRTPDGQLLALPGFQIDYGLAHNLEITTIVPFIFQTSNKNIPNAQGLGDIQLGMKYALLIEKNNQPQLAFAPIYVTPTGNANKGLGLGGSQVQIPLWIQKSWNEWTYYGGGGYLLNSAPTLHNTFFGGAVLQRQINEKLMLGTEVFMQGSVSDDTHSFILMSLGGSYNITPSISTLFSISHNIMGLEHVVAYLGITITV